MADDVTLNAGSGGDTIAADDIAGVKFQRVKLVLGANNTNDGDVASGNPLPISDAAGSLTVDNGGTFAVQAAQSGTWNITDVSGTVSLPTGASTAAKQPALGTAGTASADVISVQGIASMTPIQVGDNSSSLTVDNAALSVTGGGVEATALRVTIASDSTGVLSVDDNGASLTIDNAGITTIAGAVSGTEMQVDVVAALPAGTNNIGDVDVLSLPALPAGTNNIGDVDAIQSGTWTVQPGNTANTTAWLVSQRPATSGGLTIFRSIDLDETEEEVKATAGQLYGWYLFNAAATTRYVKFYNATAANTTVGTTTPILTVPVPAGSAANVEFGNGIVFATALSVAATTGVADADTGAPSANDVVANVLYA